MYPVSNDYINASKARSKYEEISGYVTLTDGTRIELNDNNIVQNSVAIDWQCLNDASVFAFGGAVSTRLNISIFSDLSRYAFLGAEITLVYYLRTAPTTMEPVPVGVYYVQSSEKTANKVTVEAFDCLSKLDTFIGSTIFAGTALEIMTKICNMTHLELGLTDEYYATLPNYQANIQLSGANDCKSFRDVAKAVAQLTGTYVTSTRDGKLTLKKFSGTPVITLTEEHRYKFVPADYFCVYNGLSVTSIKGTYYYKNQNMGISIPGTYTMYPDLTMYMNDAPAWDYGTDATLQLRVQNLVNYMADFWYTPGDINLPNNPIYECGDMVRMKIGQTSIDFLVTNVQWKYKNPMTLTSIGTNPFFSDTAGVGGSSRIPGSASGSELVMYSYINDDDIVVGPGDTTWSGRLLRIAFLTKGATSAFFLASISLHNYFTEDEHKKVVINILDDNNMPTTLTGDNGSTISQFYATVPNADRRGEVDFTYLLDNVPINVIQKATLDATNELVTLFLPIPIIGENSVHTLDLYISGKSSDIVKVLIPATGLQAALIGQNMVKSDTIWDGVLSFIDTMARIVLSMGTKPIAEGQIKVETQNVAIWFGDGEYATHDAFSELVQRISVEGVALQTFSENVTIKLDYLPSVIKMSNVIPVQMGMWGWL